MSTEKYEQYIQLRADRAEELLPHAALAFVEMCNRPVLEDLVQEALESLIDRCLDAIKAVYPEEERNE